MKCLEIARFQDCAPNTPELLEAFSGPQTPLWKFLPTGLYINWHMIDWLIDCIWFHVVSTIFQSYNDSNDNLIDNWTEQSYVYLCVHLYRFLWIKDHRCYWLCKNRRHISTVFKVYFLIFTKILIILQTKFNKCFPNNRWYQRLPVSRRRNSDLPNNLKNRKD